MRLDPHAEETFLQSRDWKARFSKVASPTLGQTASCRRESDSVIVLARTSWASFDGDVFIPSPGGPKLPGRFFAPSEADGLP